LGEDYSIKNLPKMESPFELMLNNAAESKHDMLLKELTGDRYPELSHFKQMLEKPSIQMRMPFEITLR
jgi:hypothetical protein